jgi:hypothetical protein
VTRVAVRLALAAVAAAVPALLPGSARAAGSGFTLPPAAGRFSYQIGGAYRPAAGVAIVDRDWHAKPAPGRYSICYVNAFQTQAAADRWWRHNHPHLLLRSADHPVVTDPGWPGEILLDTSTAAHRRALATIAGHWIARCAAKGFAAVEPDNLDSYSRSHGLLTRADNLDYAGRLATKAHALGLAIAQKNGVELSSKAHQLAHLDFAIAEECQVYAECSSYRRVYGRHLIEIEYTDNGRDAFTTACSKRGSVVSVVLRDRDVVARGHDGYVEKWCP